MTNAHFTLLLVVPIRTQDDLQVVVESEGWHTVKDLFRKTETSYNQHWNGNYVLDQDEIPWKASQQEIDALTATKGRVIVVSDGKYHITGQLGLFQDTDGSFYVLEGDVAALLQE
jgi:hypothetical protein